ncbi:MAG: hypothetical protein RI953_1688 [Pseudomonadota bacterium]
MIAAGQRRFRNILIAGLPGVGKSTFAKSYAQMSRTEFVELDKYVERLAGKSISDIFEQDGEQRFRELEAECLERLLKRQRCTIALGGGTLVSQRSLALARQLGCIVLLTAPVSVIVERLWPQKSQRPLLADCESKEQLSERLQKLLLERQDSYEAADFFLETSYSSVDTLKIELDWLERAVLARPQQIEAAEIDQAPNAQALTRRIPLADDNYRSPREQKSGRDMSEKMERFIKAQRHKERLEKRERGDKKDKQERRQGQENLNNVEARDTQRLPRPRPEGRDGQQGPRPRAEGRDGQQGPRPRAEGRDGQQGPRPRAEGRDGQQGPRPRAEGRDGQQGPRPRAEGRDGQQGPRPRAEGRDGQQGPRPRPGTAGQDGPVPRPRSADVQESQKSDVATDEREG